MLINFYVCGPTSVKLIPHLGALKTGTGMDIGFMYLVFRNQGQGPITYGLKSLDRFFNAMLPCPTVVLSGKENSKYFNTICISPLIELQQGYSQIL